MAQEASGQIRSIPELIPLIHRTGHSALHNEIAVVPVPPYHMARHVLKNLEVVTNNPLATLDNLLLAYDEAIQHPRVKSIEYQLGDLIISSLEAQRPFIKEYML
jgi:hypothetical protein